MLTWKRCLAARSRRWQWSALALFVAASGVAYSARAEEPKPADSSAVKPLKVLLVTGGCCHDYAKQKDILKNGLEARAHVIVDQLHTDDHGTKFKFKEYASPNWAKGYDVVIHDECCADVNDPEFVEGILAEHKRGVPGVNLHCAMHCYRVSPDFGKNTIKPGSKDAMWFDYIGLQSSGHGAQLPISLKFLPSDSPITKGMTDWTTINEELYNNIQVFPTATPLIRGKQGGEKPGDHDPVVCWTNLYGDKKVRVFSTTLGHNNETVADDRYLNLVTRGLLWACDKLNDQYLKPYDPKKVGLEKPGPQPTPAFKADDNLSRGKKVSASSEQDADRNAEKAIDGDVGTRWCANGARLNEWLKIDLGKAEELSGARILWEKASPYRYKLEGSADDKNWQMLSDQTANREGQQERTHLFQANDVRYVRLTVTGLAPGAWASLFELEVFGKGGVPAHSAANSRPTNPVGLKLPRGFSGTLFAGPPEVNYPTCLTATPAGVLYVGCDENGSLDNKTGRGRVVRCIDSKHDGIADEFKVFTKVDSPRGIIFDNNTLYVLHPPRLSAFVDDNGDGVADREVVLVEGIGRDLNFRGADHTTNGIRLGIDGWIYVAVGDYGFPHAVATDGHTLRFRGGGVVRVRPDGTGLEAVSHGQRNIYDVAVDPVLNLFTRDNTNDGDGWDVRLSHVVNFANFGYPVLFKHFNNEIIQPLADSGGGSPTGALFTDEGALPAPYNRTLLTCEWGRSAIHRHALVPKGSTFSEKQETFIEIPRPTDLDVDANGRIYIASWKDGNFNYVGPNIGYVACVKPTDAPFRPVVLVKTATDSQLVELIGGTSLSQRVAAQREILRRGDKPLVVSGLQAIVNRAGDLAPRVAAMFTLEQLLGSRSYDMLNEWTKNDDLREHALRALAERKEDVAKVSPQPFVDALNDPNPRVRLQAVIGLGRLGAVAHADKLVPATADADPIVAHVAINTLVELKAADACLRGVDQGPSPVTAGCLRALQLMHEPAVVEGLLARLNKANDDATKKSYLTALLRLGLREGDWDGKFWWGTRPDTTGPYFQPVAWEKTDEIKRAVATSFAAGDAELRTWLLREAKRHRLEIPDAGPQVLQLIKQDPAFKSEGAQILASLPALNAAGLAIVVDVARDPKQPIAVRAALVRELIKKSALPAAQEGAFAALAAVDQVKTPEEFRQSRQDLLNQLSQPAKLATLTNLATKPSAGEKELAYAALLKLQLQPRAPQEAKDAAKRLLDQAWAKPATTVNLLHAIGLIGAEPYSYQVRSYETSHDEAIRAAAKYAAGELRLDQDSKNKVRIETLAYAKVLEAAQQEKGDVQLGQKLFTRQGCANCHTTDPKEPPKGPFLGGIGTRYKRPELIESILKPSAKIAQGFETQIFALSDGTQWSGFVSRESGDEVELRGQNAIVTVLPKKEIEARKKSDVSTMPDGLVNQLSVQELAAIIAYLESLPAK
ncbi:MAG TPA: discoidin domain-containing protein [Pirellulales bacterium]|jgi:putative membrane-bound dehydrogenase-like protein|nr:discoidin domain-containing protein [Pirellulales bacterium]